MDLSPREIMTDMLYQIGALNAFVKVHGGKLQHILPHGALGNRSCVDTKVAEAIVEAITRYDPSLILMTPAGELSRIAEDRGIKTAYTIFADRAYNDDGTLVSRSIEGAVIHDPDLVVERCLRMVLDKKVTSIKGNDIEVEGHSLLVHGDTKGSLKLAHRIKNGLLENGVSIQPLGQWFDKVH